MVVGAALLSGMFKNVFAAVSSHPVGMILHLASSGGCCNVPVSVGNSAPSIASWPGRGISQVLNLVTQCYDTYSA